MKLEILLLAVYLAAFTQAVPTPALTPATARPHAVVVQFDTFAYSSDFDVPHRGYTGGTGDDDLESGIFDAKGRLESPSESEASFEVEDEQEYRTNSFRKWYDVGGWYSKLKGYLATMPTIYVPVNLYHENDTVHWNINNHGYVRYPATKPTKTQNGVLAILKSMVGELTEEQINRYYYRTGLFFGDAAVGLSPNFTLDTGVSLPGPRGTKFISSLDGVLSNPVALKNSSHQMTFSLGKVNRGGYYSTNTSLIGLNLYQNETKLNRMYSIAYDITSYGKTQITRQVWFPQDEGYMIVSDIDDTLRVMGVLNYTSMAENSLLNEYKPTPGLPLFMSELNRRLDTRHSIPPMFYYLSAGLIELSRDIQTFIDRYYIPGEIHLRLGLKVLTDFLRSDATFRYKVSVLKQLHDKFPKKKLILIGDSGQADPEIYSTIFSKFPGWAKCILIRKVEGFNVVKELQKNSALRFQQAFRNVPADAWRTFTDPAELDVDKIVRGEYCV